ncbi:HK97 family phage prohead protease [Streptomyces sp. NPDC058405]|uniref:HK97 family phage prohead protease n=1 Tax=Streptomyces sp. NPDC058405 TaxID=3346482 RepID=UPI003661CCD3
MTREGGAMSVKSDRASDAAGIVRRAFPVALEIRAKAGASQVSTVEGYASVTEEPYEMWDMFGAYNEVVRSGAFTKTLGETPQVQLLLNHGGLAMAYTKAGTLRLSEDSTGLHMEADVSTKRTDVGDMLAALEDGSVDEMSFAFRVTRQMWSPDYDQRDITEVDLHRGDVSVVNFGANPATAVGAMRSADFDRLDEADARALYERLQRRLEPAPAAATHPLSLYLAQAEALAL